MNLRLLQLRPGFDKHINLDYFVLEIRTLKNSFATILEGHAWSLLLAATPPSQCKAAREMLYFIGL